MISTSNTITLTTAQLEMIISMSRADKKITSDSILNTLEIASKEKRAMTCTNCSDIGHTKSGCPDLVKDAECRRCKQKGDHYTAHCTKNTSRTRKCGNCKEIGHTKPNCPNRSIQIAKKSYICSHCKKAGHNGRTCPDLSSSDSEPTQNVCKNCGEKGHNKRTCKKKCSSCNSTGHNASDCDQSGSDYDSESDIGN